MKVVCACVVLSAALGAALVAAAPVFQPEFSQEPYYAEYLQPQLRQKRSYIPYYSPCAAAAGHFGGGGAYPYPGGFGLPHFGGQYGYGPHYRSDEPEEMNFSDMEDSMSEHTPSARYGYGAGLAHGGGVGVGGLPLAPGYGGSAVGVFPNAYMGGYSIPLMLTCSPSVVAGHAIPSLGGLGAAGLGAAGLGAAGLGGVGLGAGAYRDMEDGTHHEGTEPHEEQPTHASLNPTQGAHTPSVQT